MKVKCDFPPCDDTATTHIIATCSCGLQHRTWDVKVCDKHRPECEATTRRMLGATHTIEVNPIVAAVA